MNERMNNTCAVSDGQLEGWLKRQPTFPTTYLEIAIALNSLCPSEMAFWMAVRSAQTPIGKQTFSMLHPEKTGGDPMTFPAEPLSMTGVE